MSADTFDETVKEFMDACQSGDLETVKEFCANGFDPTMQENDAVQWAAAYGHLEIVKWLIQQSGHPINLTCNDHEVLRNAVQYTVETNPPTLDLLRWLIFESGQVLDPMASGGESIQLAAQNSRLDILQILLDGPAPVNLAVSRNLLLKRLAKRQHEDAIRFIITRPDQLGNILEVGGVDAIFETYLLPAEKLLLSMYQTEVSKTRNELTQHLMSEAFVSTMANKQTEIDAITATIEQLTAKREAVLQEVVQLETETTAPYAQKAAVLLEQLGCYLKSPACVGACRTGIIQTFDQLESVFEATVSTHSDRRL